MVETYAINTGGLEKFKGLTAEQMRWLMEDYEEVSKMKGVTEKMLQERMEKLAKALRENPNMTRKEFDELRNEFRIWTYKYDNNVVPTKKEGKETRGLASALNKYLEEANVKKEIKENFIKALDEYLKEVSKLKGRGVYLSPKHMEWIWEDYNQFVGKEGVSQDKLNERTEKLIDALIENPNMTKKEFDELRGSVIHPWEVEGVIVKKKPVRLPKKEIEYAIKMAKEVWKKIEEGEMEGARKILEELFPPAERKYVGGARGEWGPNVKIAFLQAIICEMAENEEEKIPIDGIFGPKTMKAIKEIQEKVLGFEGKDVDGYFGQKTRARLIEFFLEKKEEPEEKKEEQPEKGAPEEKKGKEEPEKKKEEQKQEKKEEKKEEKKKEKGERSEEKYENIAQKHLREGHTPGGPGRSNL